MRVAPAAFLVSIGWLAPAQAEIIISRARYAAGVLVVAGETSRPYQRVTLDNRFNTRTGRDRRFAFRVPYRPRDCVANVRAGSDVRPAVISNCRPTSGPAGRLATPPQGPEWRLTRPRRDGPTRREQPIGEIWRERPLR